MVNSVYITNTSATSANIIVKLYDGTNDHEMGTWDLNQDESIRFDGQTWSKSTSTSGIKISYQDDAPSGPATDDLWYETDTNIWWFWNGTYWLSVTLFHAALRDVENNSTSGLENWSAPFGVESFTGYDIYFKHFTWTAFVSGTNDGTKYWTAALSRNGQGGSATLATLNTSAASASTWTAHISTIDTYYNLSTTSNAHFYITYTKTSTPGVLYCSGVVAYHLVHI